MERSSSALHRAKRLDRLMAWIISLGGMLIIAAVLGILVFIAKESFPLFRAPRIQEMASAQRLLPGGLMLEETGRVAMTLDPESGAVTFATSGPSLQTVAGGPALPWKLHTVPEPPGEFTVLGGDGLIGHGRFKWDKPAGTEADPGSWIPSIAWEPPFAAGIPLDRIFSARISEAGGLDGGRHLSILALDAGNALVWTVQAPEAPSPGAWKRVPLPSGQSPSTARWCAGARQFFVGTQEGRLLLYTLSAEGEAVLAAGAEFGEAITAMDFALGQTSLLVGGARGSLAAFQILRAGDGLTIQRFHRFQSLPGPVQGFMASQRDKRFLSWSPGALAVDHLTTEMRLFLRETPDIRHAALSPRGDFIGASDAHGRFRSWHLDAPHPELSLKTLWAKTHYESYDKPEYVWQSTGGTDDFEPKLGLMPLVFGTLKGTLFAMLFALPLAILGAIYTSQFASPRLRATIKPMVEIMAALPSVVLGFLAGLVLAPLFERAAIQVLLLPLTTLAVALLLVPFWYRLPRRFHTTWGQGREVVWLVPLLLLGLVTALVLAPDFERIFLGGDFRAWLLHHGTAYDQRNSLVVGFAMGFAVIPIIFTISEDALTSVPHSLTSASLACGASPWQTAWRVVLPTASPGIFSAVMVGFGRAIGETMIVLMATGNTPVMDWNPFNGMRTLAANIAVETPEAPLHGTLYRVLFLTALLLFLLTFLLNTVAELVRQRLRKRYESF